MSGSSSWERVPSLSDGKYAGENCKDTFIKMSTVSRSASVSRFCPLQEKKQQRKQENVGFMSNRQTSEDSTCIQMTYKCQRKAARRLLMAAVSDTVLVLEELQHFPYKCCSIVHCKRYQM